MSKKAKPVEENKPVEAPVEETVVEAVDREEAALEDDGSEEVAVEYIDPVKGLTTRVFSLSIHGKAFKKNAKTFAEKFNGKIV